MAQLQFQFGGLQLLDSWLFYFVVSEVLLSIIWKF